MILRIHLSHLSHLSHRIPAMLVPRLLGVLIALGCGACEKAERNGEAVPRAESEATAEPDGAGLDEEGSNNDAGSATLTHEAVFGRVLDLMERMIGALEQSADVDEAVGRLNHLERECVAIAGLGESLGEPDPATAERFEQQLQAAMIPITQRSRKAMIRLLKDDPFAVDAAKITPAEQQRLLQEVSRIDAAVGNLLQHFEKAFHLGDEH